MKECENCGMELPDDWPYDLCPECLEELEEEDDIFLSTLVTDDIPPTM